MFKKILFDHIPKTAGSALHAVLTGWYGADKITPHLRGISLKDALTSYPYAHAISGHFVPLPGTNLPSEFVKVSIIRDPVDRLISLYYHNRVDVNGASSPDVFLAKQYDFLDFLELNDAAVMDLYSNAQVRHFASFSSEFYSGAEISKERLFQLAVNFAEQFDLIGVYEEFEDFVALVAIKIGVSKWHDVEMVNVTSKRPRADEISIQLWDKIAALNQLDVEFYRFIKHRFMAARTNMLKYFVGFHGGKSDMDFDRRHENILGEVMNLPISSDFGSREIEILSILAIGTLSNLPDVLSGEEIIVSILLDAHQPADDLTIGLHISEPSGARIFGINSRLLGMVLSITSPGQTLVHFKMKCELGFGEYRVGAAIHKGATHLEKCYHWREYCTTFHVAGTLGAYFEGKFRLYPSVSVEGGEDYPSTFELIETGIGYPKSIMLQSAPLTEFLIHFQIDDSNYQPKAGEIFNLICRVTNAGTETWPIAGIRPVNISYHWVDRNRNVVIFDGLRTRLSSDFKHTQLDIFPIQIQAPYQPGDYILQITAVQEGVGWFDEKGCAPFELPFTVLE